MRRLVIGAGLVGGAVVLARAVAPRLHARMLGACERMFEQLPDEFPPKRMLSGIEEIRATSARTLELLEERTEAVQAERLGEAPPPRTTTPEAVRA